MLGERTYGDGIAVEIASVEDASKRLLEALDAGGFRARVERRVTASTGLLGRSRELLVDGESVWRGEWLAEGGVMRWDARWLVDPATLGRGVP